MYRQILIVAVLSVTAASAAFAKDLPRGRDTEELGAQAEESGSDVTLEIFDQRKTIKFACGTFQVEEWAPSENDKRDSTSVNCDGVLIDANWPLLWEYAKRKQRLEKAVLSSKPGKGQPYMIEVPNVTVAHLSILGDTIGINLLAASSRLIVPPRRQ